jgi:hypothetical protein
MILIAYRTGRQLFTLLLKRIARRSFLCCWRKATWMWMTRIRYCIVWLYDILEPIASVRTHKSNGDSLDSHRYI